MRLYEAQETLGGRTARITLADDAGRDFHFDRGPTFFLMPYVLEEIFQAAGRDLHDYARLTPLDPMYRLIVGDRAGGDPTVIDATQDVEEMARRLGAVHGPDGEAFGRFIRDNREKLARSEPILRRPIRSAMDLVRMDGLRALPHLKPTMSVHDLLSRYFEDPRVRLAVSFQSKYLGMSPYDCPSLFTILPFIEYEFGIWHPTGGCNALMGAMAEVAQELGVEIRAGSPVEEIVFEGTRATGVVVGGAVHRHAHVVVNADATWAIKNLIPESVRRRADATMTDARVDGRKYSCSTSMLYLGVEGAVDLPHHTIYVSSRYEENLEDISRTGAMSVDPSVYVHNPSAIDPTLAPEGCSSLYVLVPTPNLQQRQDWSEAEGQLREAALDQVAGRFGVSDIRDRIRCELAINPRDWERSGVNLGATFNLAHNYGQMLHKRPHHRLKGFDGLWLVGGGTHPGSGLPVIFLSSQITSRMLCDELGVDYAGSGTAVDTAQGAARSRELVARSGAMAHGEALV